MRPDPDLLQEWILRDGVAASEVGGRLGLSRAAGYSWLRRYGISADGTPLPQAELTALWRSGKPAARRAAVYGVSASAIRERLVAAAVLPQSRSYFVVGSADDPLPEHLLREWYVQQHFSVEQIAALTGTTARQVRYRLTRYRLSRGRPGPAPQLQRRLGRADLIRLYHREGLTCPEIAKRAGASAEAVRELLAAYGIARRPSGTRARRPVPVEAVRDFRRGTVTVEELAVRLGYVTSSGKPAVRRLRTALTTAPTHRHEEILERARLAQESAARTVERAKKIMASLAA